MIKKPKLAVFDMVTSVGGVQNVMASLMACLKEEFEISVIDTYENEDYKEYMGRAGLTCQGLGDHPDKPYIGGKHKISHSLGLAARSPWMLRTAFRLRRWVASNRPDIVYFNQLRSAIFFSKFLPPRRPMLVYHAHGFASPTDVRSGDYLSKRFVKLFAVSNCTARQLEKAGVSPEKIVVVPNGIDVEKIRCMSKSDGKSLPERPRLGFIFVQVGVINPNKGQDLAVQALAKLPTRATLWICGDVPVGGDRSYLRRLYSSIGTLGLEDRVHFLGWRDDVPRVLATGDVCILPSVNFESFGMAAAEAMALGKPCIGTDVGGIAEVIEDGRTGIIVLPDVDSLASAMIRLEASAALRKEMGEAGLCRVNRLFSLPVQAQRITFELRNLVA